METNQQNNPPSSPDNDDQHLNPEDSVHQSAAHEVSFAFNHLQINTNSDDSDSKNLIPESPENDISFGFNHLEINANSDSNSLNPMLKSPEIDVEEDDVSFGFNHLQINANSDSDSLNLMLKSPEIDVEDDDVEGDFTFVCVGDNDSPFDEVSGQIRMVFPLFDRSLLLDGDYDDENRRLPTEVPVDKVFIESENGETSGTFRALSTESRSGTPEINMKSNSTGFSKLLKLRNEMNRSNSDSRDAFVFLESSDPANAVASGGSTAKVNAAGGKGKAVKKGTSTKKSTASAHEVYLKQKGGQTEEDRRRSYLPYRPGLMGFFTNVNGGLSKNVHPF